MSGQRLDLVKETSHFLIDKVSSCDLLGFLSYDDTVCEDVPLMHMTEPAKRFAHTVVESLRVGGCTALCDGTLAGMRQQCEALDDDARTARALLLCSDGHANVGPGSARGVMRKLRGAQAAAGALCTVHTFGIGTDHDAMLLQAVAEGMAGQYYCVHDHADVAPAYGDAVGGLLSVVAKNVRVAVATAPGSGAALAALHAGGAARAAPAPGTAAFNDIYSEESRELVVDLGLAAAWTCGEAAALEGRWEQRLGDVCIEYVDPTTGAAHKVTVPLSIVRAAGGGAASGASPHPTVLTSIVRFEAAAAIETAQQLTDAGRLDDAVALLRSFASDVRRRAESTGGGLTELDIAMLRMLCDQVEAVAGSMRSAAASCTRGARSQQATLSKAATLGLVQQRVASVGVTSMLPSTAHYDTLNKQASRASVAVAVSHSMQFKGYSDGAG